MTAIPRYFKILDSIPDSLSPGALALYIAIVRSVTPQNHLRISISDLAARANMSRNSVIKHTRELERQVLVYVRRDKGVRSADINIYSLIGDGAQVSLWQKPAKPEFSDSRSEFEPPAVQKLHGDSDKLREKKDVVVDGEEALAEPLQKVEIPQVIQPTQDATPEAEPVPVDLHQFFQHMVTTEFTPYLLRDIDYARFCVQYTKSAQGVKYPQGFAAKQIREDGLKADFEAWSARQIALTRDTPPRPVVSPPPPTPSPLKAETETADPPHVIERGETETVQRSLQVDWQPPGEQEQSWWAMALGQLELQFDRQTYGMYLQGARLLGVKDGALIVGVRGPHTRDWCAGRLYRDIWARVRDVVGVGTEIEFVDTQGAAV